jgi:hypothetical protein
MLEKASFGIAAVVLFALGRIPATLLAFGAVDLLWGVLFLMAFVKVGRESPAAHV